MIRGHRGHGRGAGSFGSSRSSLGVGFMPVIVENEVAQSPPSPPKPLRVPQKHPRRGPGPLGPRGLPPPYVPPYILEPPTLHHPPPSYKEADANDEETDSQPQSGAESRRKRFANRWCCILGVAVIISVIIAVALAVGLTIGLKDRNHGSSDETKSSDTAFPAGSFTLKLDLLETKTNCTSNPSTWSCYPYNEGDEATFYWVITAQDTSGYTISSTDNPFVPSFEDRPMKVIDAGKPTERLQFSFNMSKTVTPLGKLAPNNRAARCTFDGTVFEATLWTRRHGDQTIDPEPGDIKYGAWPCNAEIVQIKESQQGQPVCEDSDGNLIADVQAEAGTCECLYSNFDN